MRPHRYRLFSLSRRGFNLVEAAIVLGVVGLVIGGIWVAAATVSENMKVGATVSGVLFLQNQLNNIMPMSQASSTLAVDIRCSLGVYPADWPCTDPMSGAGNATTPTGQKTTGYVAFNYFRFTIGQYPDKMSASVCTKIITEFFQKITPSDTLTSLSAHGGTNITKNTATIDTIYNACKNSAAQIVPRIQFNLPIFGNSN